MSTFQIQQCKVCTKRSFDKSIGIVCGITMAKPTFEGKCTEGELDTKEAERITKLHKEVSASGPSDKGFFGMEKAGIKKGVLGGILMMGGAVVWFVVGYQAGYIFYYPPILFVIGVVALVKGLIQGNYAGKNN